MIANAITVNTNRSCGQWAVSQHTRLHTICQKEYTIIFWYKHHICVYYTYNKTTLYFCCLYKMQFQFHNTKFEVDNTQKTMSAVLLLLLDDWRTNWQTGWLTDWRVGCLTWPPNSSSHFFCLSSYHTYYKNRCSSECTLLLLVFCLFCVEMKWLWLWFVVVGSHWNRWEYIIFE